MQESKREWDKLFTDSKVKSKDAALQSRKRPKASLDGFLSLQEPFPIYMINESKESDSRFLALSHPINKPKQATDFHSFVKRKYPDASHVVLGWKVVCLKEGRLGIDGPDDFEQRQGFLDDGERWAGERVMYNTDLDTACVVVRWFGGQLLGARRFEIFSGLAKEVCAYSTLSEELRLLQNSIQAIDLEMETLQNLPAKNLPLSTALSSYVSKSITIPILNKDLIRSKRIKDAKKKKLEFLKSKVSSNCTVDEHADKPPNDIIRENA